MAYGVLERRENVVCSCPEVLNDHVARSPCLTILQFDRCRKVWLDGDQARREQRSLYLTS